jgi:hypothetical protein
MNLGPETPISMNGSMSSILPLATITDSTRQALLAALAQCTPFGGRKYSFPAASPLSPHFPGRASSVNDATRNLPSKSPRYVYCLAFLGNHASQRVSKQICSKPNTLVGSAILGLRSFVCLITNKF